MWKSTNTADPQIKIFYLSLRSLVLGALALNIKDAIFFTDAISILIQTLVIGVAYLFHWLYRKGHSIDKLSIYLGIFLLVSLSIGSVISGGGLTSGNLAIFIIIIFCSTAVIPKNKQIPMAIFGLFCLITVAVFEYIDPSIRFMDDYGTRSYLLRSDAMILVIVTIGYIISRQIIMAYLDEREKNFKNFEKIKEQTKELESISAFKTKLFAILSHDLISPLQSINNVVGLVKNNLVSTEDLNKVIPEISKKVNHTNHLVNDLLYWSRINIQQNLLNMKPFDLHATITNVIRLYTPLFEKKRLKFRNCIPEDQVLVGDERLIASVCRNLISNACKFTHPQTEIVIDFKQEGNRAHVRVKDQGIGINEEKLSTIFEGEAESSEGTDGESGSGIGLKLCYDFIKLHKGEIWCENNIEGGSTFIFSIPLLEESNFSKEPKSVNFIHEPV